MQTEKLPLDVYERLYGELPNWFKLPGCVVVRAVDHLTNEAVLSIELAETLPTETESVQ